MSYERDIPTIIKCQCGKGKIIKEISTMLNNSNPKDKIAKAEVITEYEAFSIFPDIIELYKNTED